MLTATLPRGLMLMPKPGGTTEDRDKSSPVPANVKRLRGKTSQEALAERAGEGWNQQLISQIETGRWNPSYEKLAQLAAALGVTVDVLYRQGDTPGQLALAPADTPRHEDVLADLTELAQTRPDLRRTMRDLRANLDEEKYRQALLIIWRHMVSGIETARDLLIPNAPKPRATRKP